MDWKILEIEAEGDLITRARYLVTAVNDVAEISTEGWWYFNNPVLSIPFAEVKESDVIGWIDSQASEPTNFISPDGTVTIDSNHKITNQLQKQLAELTERANKKVVLPWLPQVFTPNI